MKRGLMMKNVLQKFTISTIAFLSVACASHGLAQTSTAPPPPANIDISQLGLIEGDYALDTARSDDKSGEICGDTNVKWTGLHPPILMLDVDTFFSDFNKGDIHEREDIKGVEVCQNVFNTTMNSGNVRMTETHTCSKSGQSQIEEDLRVEGNTLIYTFRKKWLTPPQDKNVLEPQLATAIRAKCVLKLK